MCIEEGEILNKFVCDLLIDNLILITSRVSLLNYYSPIHILFIM